LAVTIVRYESVTAVVQAPSSRVLVTFVPVLLVRPHKLLAALRPTEDASALRSLCALHAFMLQDKLTPTRRACKAQLDEERKVASAPFMQLQHLSVDICSITR
jgi:hypothetical protein